MSGYFGNMISRIRRGTPGLHPSARLPFSGGPAGPFSSEEITNPESGSRPAEAPAESPAEPPRTETTRPPTPFSPPLVAAPPRTTQVSSKRGPEKGSLIPKDLNPAPKVPSERAARQNSIPRESHFRDGDFFQPGLKTPPAVERRAFEKNIPKDIPAPEEQPKPKKREEPLSESKPVGVSVTEFLMPSRQPDGTGAKESSPTKGGSLESRRNDLLEGKADPSRVETVQNSLEPFLPRWENPKAGSLLKPKREARAEPALRNESPDIHVHIGRIEVNAVTPLPAPKNRKEPAVKPMSLEEYAQYRRRRPS